MTRLPVPVTRSVRVVEVIRITEEHPDGQEVVSYWTPEGTFLATLPREFSAVAAEQTLPMGVDR